MRPGLLDEQRGMPAGHAGPVRAPGAAVLFTGLSGAGKTTIARGVQDAVAGEGQHTVSLLDGDEVRAELAAELGFSAADRHRSVARLAFVAEHIVRHGGLALCAAIAPYATIRAAFRDRIGTAGEFVLVHVSTPLATCETRDVKGLYARARAGELIGFTGVSDPYEEPTDADVVLDTRSVSLSDAVDAVLDELARRRWGTRARPS